MRDRTNRALRGLFQVSFVESVIVLLTVFDVIHWTTEQHAAVTAVMVPVVAFLQNLIEDNIGAGILREVPKPGQPAVVTK